MTLQIQKDAARGEKIPPPPLAFLDTHQAPCMVVIGQHFKDGRFMATFLNQVLQQKSCKLMTATRCNSFRCKMHVAAAPIGVLRRDHHQQTYAFLFWSLVSQYRMIHGQVTLPCIHYGTQCSASQRSLLLVMMQHDLDKVSNNGVLL